MKPLLGLVVAALLVLNAASAQVAIPYQTPSGIPVAMPYFPTCGNLVDILTSQVVTNTCAVTACGGTSVGGSCWYASTTSCDDVCAAHGGYNTATLDYAGSNGTDANCTAVYQAVSGDTTRTAAASAHVLSVSPGGCMLYGAARSPISLLRDTSAATTSAASMTPARSTNAGTRYCACNQ